MSLVFHSRDNRVKCFYFYQISSNSASFLDSCTFGAPFTENLRSWSRLLINTINIYGHYWNTVPKSIKISMINHWGTWVKVVNHKFSMKLGYWTNWYSVKSCLIFADKKFDGYPLKIEQHSSLLHVET
jgi:hypothetical protein